MKKALCLILSLSIVLSMCGVGLAEGSTVNDQGTLPVTEPATEPTVEPEAEPATEPEEEPATEPEEQPVTEPEGETATEPEGETATEPEGETVTEPEAEPATEPEGEPATEPEEQPVTEPEGETATEHEGETATEPEGEPATEPEGEPVTEPEEEPATEPEGEPATEPEEEPATEPEAEPATEHEGEPATEPEEEPAAEEFAILEQPTNVTADIGETVNLTVKATGVVKYQWQNSRDGAAWSNSGISGYNTDTLSFSMIEARYPYQWRCELTDANGDVHYTNAVVINKPELMTITKQPDDATGEVGETVYLTVEATGVAKYQWQNSKDGSSWSNSYIDGYNAATLNLLVNEVRYDYQWRCVLTDKNGNTLTTDAVNLLRPIPEEEFAILEQPTNIEANVGDPVNLTVKATGVVKYQWQNSLNGETWSNSGISGYNTDTLSFNMLEVRYPYQWRCVLTDANGEEHYTNAVVITKPVMMAIVKEPEDVEAEVGTTVELTVEATGVAKYQWQNSLNGENWSNSGITGFDTATLSVPVTEGRYAYLWRCVLTAANGTVLETKAVRLIKPAPAIPFEIVKHPQSVKAEVGTTVELTVEATGVAKYQWQNSLNGENWSNSGIAGFNTATLSVPVTEGRYAYLWRCVLTGEDGTTLETNAVSIIKPVKLEITKEPEDVEAEVGTTVELTVEATGVVKYQWQNSLNGENWSNSGITGFDTATLSVPVTEGRYAYLWRCVLTGDDGNTLETKTVRLIKPAPAVPLEIVKQPENIIAAVNEVIELTVEATGVAKYQWQNSLNGENWSNSGITGFNTATLSVPVTEGRYAYLWRCVLTGEDGTTLETDAVSIIKPVALEIVNQPVDAMGDIGETVQLTVEAKGVVAYQWQNSADGDIWNDVAFDGFDAAVLNVPVTEESYGYLWRCVLTGQNDSSLETDAVCITPKAVFEIVEQPTNVMAEVDTIAELTVVATGVAKYQWQNSLNGENWSNSGIPGFDTATLSVPVTEGRYAYLWRCVLTSATGEELITDAVMIERPAIELDGVTYERIDETTLRVVSYAGDAASVVIPEVVDGMTVTEIGEGAFENNAALVSIDLPDTITRIGTRAFKNCTSLSEMY